ncbi:MAG: helix-turn-helix transcriptional regulator [Acidobacteriaceae bacterium]|nr:helix-turn-helix transcriptional regulator [Acidobacteriaceae bacterium]MBV9499833.1 helix-turn-helix transcriptional regulator [Acidobacteriaceae bacterium]
MPDRDVSGFLGLPATAFHILVSLADGDRHGYAIMREVAERTGGKLKLNAGTLYTTIKRLLSNGLIAELGERPDVGKDDERRRYYCLTPFGRKVVRAEAARLEDLLSMARKAGLVPKRA